MAYILLVEDTQDNRAIAELILRDAGHTVLSVADGESGMAAAAAKIQDDTWRASFLEAVPENAEAIALARRWQ